MIEARTVDVETGVIVWFCAECEKEFCARVEIVMDYKTKNKMKRKRQRVRMRQFESCHDYCGSDKAAEKLAQEKWDEAVRVMKMIYDNRPGIGFEEAKKLFVSLDELAREVKANCIEKELTQQSARVIPNQGE